MGPADAASATLPESTPARAITNPITVPINPKTTRLFAIRRTILILEYRLERRHSEMVILESAEAFSIIAKYSRYLSVKFGSFPDNNLSSLAHRFT